MRKYVPKNDHETHEALINVSYELLYRRDQNSPESIELLQWVARRMNVTLPSVYPWYIPWYDVKWQIKLFDKGSRSTLHHGTVVGYDTKFVIKRLFESHQLQSAEAFVREAEIWSSLIDPHVIKFYGACHLATTPFFICESAGEHRNFVDYFSERKSERRANLWHLLHEAALGLQHLHERGIVHGSIKCRGLLVSADGKAKLCGFGSSFVLTRDQPIATNENPAKDVRWTPWKH